MKYKVGQIVAACYDGKWSRAVEARVVKATSKYIEVEFVPWANEESGLVRMRAFNRTPRRTTWMNRTKRRSRRYYGGFLAGPGEWGIMRGLGSNGDYYSIVRVHRLQAEQYDIAPLIRQPQARELVFNGDQPSSSQLVRSLADRLSD